MSADLNPHPDFDLIPNIADDVEKLVIDVMEEVLDDLKRQEPSVDWVEVFRLLREEHNMVASGDQVFEQHFKTIGNDVDFHKLAAYERLALVKNTVRSYAPVMAERAHNFDTGATSNLMREHIRQMRALGFSYVDTVKFFDQDAKISKSPTPHPTEGLSINGVKLVCKLVEAFEVEPDYRLESLKSAIRNMVLSEDVGASHKFTIMDEAELSDFYAHNHNAGISELEREIETFIEEEYGERPVITLDAALRSWDYDSDGKNNADGFAFMAKASRTTLAAVDQVLDAIDGLAVHPIPELSAFQRDLVAVKSELSYVANHSSEIVQSLAAIQDPVERSAHYREVYAHYRDLEQRFSDVYKAAGSSDRGFDFYKRALRVLDHTVSAMSDAHMTDNDIRPIDDALRLLRRTGVALEKGQPRQNDFEHIAIINNLFDAQKGSRFRSRGVFRADELQEIDDAGGYKNLSHERQQKFLGVLSSYIAQSAHQKQVLSDLFEANPLEFDPNGNGYPIQTRTLLDRLSLRQMYQLKFDQGIISDAQPGSDDRMHFLFQVFGIRNGTSMSLHEDRGTLPKRSQLLEEFALKVGGKTLEKTRGFYSSVLKGTPLDKTSSKDTWAIIHPASDAERGGGPGTRMETSSVVRSISKLSYRSGVTIAQMLGGGMHITRFGGNPVLVFNSIAEELKHQVKKDGKGRFDRRVQEDRHIMRSATTMSFTEQGRHKRYNMSTPMQVADSYARKISRMIAVRFDLEGLVQDNTFIASKPHFESLEVQERMDELWKKQIDRFNQRRFAVGSDGHIILDKLAETITTPLTIGYKNNGARPAAKAGAAKSMTGVRAIENAIRGDLSGLHMGGFQGAGTMMRDIVDDLKEKRISFNTVQDWLKHPEWSYSVHEKCLIEAGKSVPHFALENLEWCDATFDELKEVGEQVRFVKFDGEDDNTMVYRGDRKDLSEEQIYFAGIWYERLLYVSHMEAGVNGSKAPVNLLSCLDDIIHAFRPEDNSPDFGLGKKTLAVFPDVAITLEEHEKNRPQLIIQHIRERQLKADIENGMDKNAAVERQGGEAQLRCSGATYRAGTAPHWAYWASKKSYGRKPVPEGFAITDVMTDKARADVDHQIGAMHGHVGFVCAVHP